MPNMRITCAKNVRGWGQKSVGKLPHLPHFFYSCTHNKNHKWENLLSFATKRSFKSHVYPRQILNLEQRKTHYISTVSTLPITTTITYI